MPFADTESLEELNTAFNYLGVNPKNDSGVGPDLHKDKWDLRSVCIVSFQALDIIILISSQFKGLISTMVNEEHLYLVTELSDLNYHFLEIF